MASAASGAVWCATHGVGAVFLLIPHVSDFRTPFADIFLLEVVDLVGIVGYLSSLYFPNYFVAHVLEELYIVIKDCSALLYQTFNSKSNPGSIRRVNS